MSHRFVEVITIKCFFGTCCRSLSTDIDLVSKTALAPLPSVLPILSVNLDPNHPHLAYALGGWSNEGKDGLLDKWYPGTTMVSVTIKFAIATGRLEDRSNESDQETGEEDNGEDGEDMV